METSVRKPVAPFYAVAASGEAAPSEAASAAAAAVSEGEAPSAAVLAAAAAASAGEVPSGAASAAAAEAAVSADAGKADMKKMHGFHRASFYFRISMVSRLSSPRVR